MGEPAHNTYQDNPEVERERTDVDTRAILRFGAGILGGLVATFLLLFGLFAYFNVREARVGRGPARLVKPEQLPPEPTLEISPRANLAELRAAENQALETYGWVDKERGVVRIPIERAMEIIAERGLPARKQKKEDEKKAANISNERSARSGN
jgi:hypothetical protein